ISLTEIGVTDEADYKLIPADMNALIGKIIVHPLSLREFRNEVQGELKSYSIRVHVAGSGLRSCDLKAVTRSKR
ncbi:MAG: hypothetical protein ABI651_07770, partial [Verrucomicrobiota bacterium]